MTRPVHISALLVITSAVLCACDSGVQPEPRRVGIDAYIDTSQNVKDLCGTILIDKVSSSGPQSSSPLKPSTAYRSIFVRSSDYTGMEDNDIRGYLDGSFKEGWNQVSQSHLRLGRRGRNPAYGEYEIFRNLQRWDGLTIPPTSTVADSELRLTLESGPPFAVTVAIYAVKKDWFPGAGGINRDNNSPPAPGEVWWVDARNGELAWTRAGAGFASDMAENADTGAQPLALARYEPRKSGALVFRSTRLSEYIQDRLRASEPLLFMFKLTDAYEDSIGSVMEIWSANHGIDGSKRRPQLAVHWMPDGTTERQQYSVALEHGRQMNIGRLDIQSPTLVVWQYIASSVLTSKDSSFEHCTQSPHVEIRAAGKNQSWSRLEQLSTLDAGLYDIRVAAAQEPVPLGTHFESRIRETWVTTGNPADQDVKWIFTSPDERRFVIKADYQGDFEWRVRFLPDMLGRWTYIWEHSLAGERAEGMTNAFDVVAWDFNTVMAGLKSLSDSIDQSGAKPRSQAMLPYEIAFMKLERAAMVLPDAETGQPSEKLAELNRIIRELRHQLSGSTIPREFQPESIRMERAKAN